MIQNKDGTFSLEAGDVVRVLDGDKHVTYVAKNAHCGKYLSDRELAFPDLAPNISTEGLIFSRRDTTADIQDLLHSYNL